MRLLYLIDSLVAGGAERSLVAMAPGLIDSGIELEVAYLRDRPGLQSRLLEAGAKLYCLDGPGGRMGYVKRVRRRLLEAKPDIFHTTLADSDLVGSVASLGIRTKLVCSLVNVQYGREHASDPNVLAWRMRMLQALNVLTAKRVDRFHAVTEEVAEVMGRRLLVARGRIDVIHRGRDPVALGVRTPQRRQRARDSLGIGEDRLMILAVARHEYQKRLDALVKAVRVLVDEGLDAVLFIAGREGSATSELKLLVEDEGLEDRVSFLGPRDDIPELMCAGDVLVLPSRREGFPGVLVEALALELPIVASDLRGAREAVGDGTARLLQKIDPQTIATAVRKTVSEPDETHAMSSRGRTRFIEQHTIGSVTRRMIELYEKTLRGSGLMRMARSS